MSLGIGSDNPYFQYLGQIQSLTQSNLEALRSKRESSTDSIIRKAGESSVKNQEVVLSTLQKNNQLGQAIDIKV